MSSAAAVLGGFRVHAYKKKKKKKKKKKHEKRTT